LPVFKRVLKEARIKRIKVALWFLIISNKNSHFNGLIFAQTVAQNSRAGCNYWFLDRTNAVYVSIRVGVIFSEKK
jgi:hypothetical protein